MSVALRHYRPVVRSLLRGIFPVEGGSPMILVMATTGAAETVTIPCQNVGTFDASIDWGDGTTTTVLAYNSAGLAHEFADIGDHTITITGTFPNIYFNNVGDKLKVKEVVQLGKVGLIRLTGAFYGCTNLTSLSSGVTDTSNVTDTQNMVRGCSGLVDPDVSTIDTSSVANFGNMFREITAANDVIGLDLFDISSATSLSLILHGSTILTSRYDAVLIAWEAQTVASGLSVSFGSSQYTPGGAAEQARTDLINNDLWTIVDGGPVP